MSVSSLWLVEVTISECDDTVGHPIWAEDLESAIIGGGALYKGADVKIVRDNFLFMTSNSRWLVEGTITQDDDADVLSHIIWAKNKKDARRAGDFLFPPPGRVTQVRQV